MRLIAGDVESTGLNSTDKVVEIAWAELDDDFNILSSTRSLINPEIPIPAGASAVHGIVADHVRDAPTICEFMAELEYPLAGDEIIFSAHNAQFDAKYFKPWMPDYMGSICTLKLAREVYPDADNHKLQTLRYFLELDVDVAHNEAHTALADVKVLVSLLRKIKADTGWDVVDMFEFCNTPREIVRMPFGKHKGTRLKDLPKTYVRWLLGLADLDADLRYSLEKLG